jgi:hypothetical protein
MPNANVQIAKCKMQIAKIAQDVVLEDRAAYLNVQTQIQSVHGGHLTPSLKLFEFKTEH